LVAVSRPENRGRLLHRQRDRRPWLAGIHISCRKSPGASREALGRPFSLSCRRRQPSATSVGVGLRLLPSDHSIFSLSRPGESLPKRPWQAGPQILPRTQGRGESSLGILPPSEARGAQGFQPQAKSLSSINLNIGQPFPKCGAARCAMAKVRSWEVYDEFWMWI